ncbi:MAG: outer membrane lipoprotein carrier protein LolA [Spirochaetes bacterium]|nr:outer membrane lipoprotein carrier protein LolA [Spirochaetota bacterium]
MTSKRSIITLSILSALLFAAPGLKAYQFDFVTVGDVVHKVKKKFGSLTTYQADFAVVSQKTGKTKAQSGIIKYRASDNLLIEFHQPPGQRIVSNGRVMWIYIPSMNVVAEQNLKAESAGLFSSNTKSGLTRLFSKYHYRFASKEQPETQSDGSKFYTLYLKQRETRSGFRTLQLWISEDYFITKAKGETSTGKVIEITFSNIRTNVSLPSSLFRFDVPSRARVIKNPMISEE